MWKKVLRSRWISAGIGLAIIAVFFAVARIYPKLRAVQKQASGVEKTIKTLEERKEELERNSAYLNSEAYLERQARLKLNVKKPDEKVVFVYKDQYTTQSPSPDTDTGNQKVV